MMLQAVRLGARMSLRDAFHFLVIFTPRSGIAGYLHPEVAVHTAFHNTRDFFYSKKYIA